MQAGKFTFYRIPMNWILEEEYECKARDGKSKMQQRRTYHPTLEQVAKEIVDRCAGECETMRELGIRLRKAATLVESRLKYEMKKKEKA